MNQIQLIEINKIKPDSTQPRKDLTTVDIPELAQTIKSVGIINPIEIDKDYVIVTGEMRWRAAKEAGLKEIPCKIIEVTKDERFLRQFVENTQHARMTAWDTAQALNKMLTTMLPGNKVNCPKSGVTADKCISELARRIGKSRDFIQEHLDLLESSEKVIKAVRSGKLPISHTRAITRAPQEHKKAIEKKVLSGEFKSRDGAVAVVSALNRNPEKAKEILEKDYSKYETTQEIHGALQDISPLYSDRIAEGMIPPKQLGKIVLNLSAWLEDNSPASVGSFHLKKVISDLVFVKEEIDKWLKNNL